MVYFKVLLDSKRKKEDSVYPVVIRLTFNRLNTSISTGVRIHEEQWDKDFCKVKGGNTNAQMLNNEIATLYAKVERIALTLEQEGCFSFAEVKRRLTSKEPVKRVLTVDDFANSTISNLIAEGKTGNALVYQAAWNRLSKFNLQKPISFKQLTSKFLQEFKLQLIKDEVRVNTISNYLRTIRALCNRAIKEGECTEEQYPFKYFKIENEPTLKRAISFVDLKKLLVHRREGVRNEWHSVNYFFLSVSLIGISFTDLAYLKKTDIVDDRLIYIRRKTKKVYSIKLTPLSQSIINIYSSNDRTYILPVMREGIKEDSLQAHKIVKQWIKTTNHYLDKLSKQLKIGKVTTYVARHSWATTAKRLGYSNEVIAEALGHEYGNRVTNTYLDSFESSIIDDINLAVLKQLE